MHLQRNTIRDIDTGQVYVLDVEDEQVPDSADDTHGGYTDVISGTKMSPAEFDRVLGLAGTLGVSTPAAEHLQTEACLAARQIVMRLHQAMLRLLKDISVQDKGILQMEALLVHTGPVNMADIHHNTCKDAASLLLAQLCCPAGTSCSPSTCTRLCL